MLLKRPLTFLLVALVIVAVFDPANKVTNLKVPLFVASWLLFGIAMLASGGIRLRQPVPVLVVTLLFAVLLPLLSVTRYAITNSDFSYFEDQYFRSYLFFTLVIVLSATDIDLVRPLCVVLTWLSGIVVNIGALTFLITPEEYLLLYDFGAEFGVLALHEREYGGATFLDIYYVRLLS